jgi:hypothetical protein
MLNMFTMSQRSFYGVRLDPAVIAALRALARATGESQQDIVEAAIRAHIRRQPAEVRRLLEQMESTGEAAGRSRE